MRITSIESNLLAEIDVGYTERESKPTTAIADCVVINDWRGSTSSSEYVVRINDVSDYQPGQFYRRELPCIESALAEFDQEPTCVVVDGYVWLDNESHPGLGAHLYNSLNKSTPVIGVAKNPYKQSEFATQLRRGISTRPLYITSVGVPIAQAVINIGAMHGPQRYPTILKRVDHLSRHG